MPEILYLSEIESSLARVLLVVGIALVLPFVFKRHKNWHRGAIFAVAGIAALRYLWWRATETIAPFGMTWDCAASWSLLGLERLSLIRSLSSFVILFRTRDRSDEATRNLGWWAPAPHVAILIATYNEELEVLERTIIGAKALAYPAKEIIVLDDGHRDWLRDYCKTQKVRYISRPDNAGAKAGNINYTLGVLATDKAPPAFVAILDADIAQSPRAIWR
jgi:cellulose synthase (UDP-forming)